MKTIHELVAYFLRHGWITEEQKEKLIHKGMWASDDPGNLEGYRNRVGECFYFHTQGRLTGPLWGTDTYTSDSNLGTAAVHAGLLTVGQVGIVKVTIVSPIPFYPGSTRNGATSHSWSTGWHGAYVLQSLG